MSFEDRFLGGLDRKREKSSFLHPNVEKAGKRTEMLFRSEAIRIRDFEGIYPQEQIDSDIFQALRLRKKFETQDPHKVYADVMEGVTYRQIKESQWFGEGATAIKTSDYDDYINGVDLMVEFQESPRSFRHLGLAIDVTFSENADNGTMDKKFDRIRKEINEGRLANVKYFQSKNSRMKGIFENLPRVIVGMERIHVTELASIWMNEDRHDDFKTHPVQRMILEQILFQLKAFAHYATEQGQDEVAQILRDEIPLIQGILNEKKHLALGDLAKDKVNEQIVDQTRKFI